MLYQIESIPAHFQGCFSPERKPIAKIALGDTVSASPLEAGWGKNPFGEGYVGIFADCLPNEHRVDPANDRGHCLIGPVEIEGAEPGMTLEIRIDRLRPAPVGWTFAGECHELYERLGLGKEIYHLGWHIDAEAGTATSGKGHKAEIAPFLGVIGLSPAEPGIHPTRPPRRVGGNIDCKDLVEGTTLYLPVEVPGGMLAFGDGHAAQGDGEICGTAIECGMDVQLTVTESAEFKSPLKFPRAKTADHWICFGFDEDLTEAMVIATNNMLDFLQERLSIPRIEAIALSSIYVDLKITQIVNKSMGVQAQIGHEALSRL
jgi:acetamidase/formamidase